MDPFVKALTKMIADKTETQPEDWLTHDSPYGKGVEYVFYEKNGSRAAYVVVVENNISISVV